MIPVGGLITLSWKAQAICREEQINQRFRILHSFCLHVGGCLSSGKRWQGEVTEVCRDTDSGTVIKAFMAQELEPLHLPGLLKFTEMLMPVVGWMHRRLCQGKDHTTYSSSLILPPGMC